MSPTEKPGICVVLPTYNEADNLSSIVSAIATELSDLSSDYVILVVDDNSPDGTGDIATKLATENGHLAVLHRTHKQGLGPAYIAGFRWALEQGNEIVLQMDSDFSHAPEDIPRLVEASQSAGLVLGSRYVPGGRVERWGLVRRLLSSAGCWYARMMLRVRIRDITGGFKCFRREVLEAVLSSDLRASGYGFQIEVTYRTLKAGFVVKEIPIVFHERRAGISKMSARIAAEAAWQVLALKLVQWRPTSPCSIDIPVTVDDLPDALRNTGTGSR
jgi:dolichol-phosphate mannosyltransferase